MNTSVLGQFDCQPLTRVEVARQLAEAQIVASRAMPGATLYTLKTEVHEWLLVALPGGAGLAIDIVRPPPKRRRGEAAKASPASR
jgi:hypothetical protein